jgi:predicted NBD/HSP70 family sugar kinase
MEGVRDLIVINVGWGVGAGIVHGGRLLHGNPLGAGEIGHVVVDPDGERCRCGNYGCLETVVSTQAILRRARTLARKVPDSLLHRFATCPEAITFDTVCHMFAAGDKVTRHAIHEIGSSLGIAVSNLVGSFGGCRILIAGPLSCFGPFLLDAIRQEMDRRCFPSLAQQTEIGFVSLGSNIVLLGASALLLQNELGLFAAA